MPVPIEELFVKVSADIGELKSEMAAASATVKKSTSAITKSVNAVIMRFFAWTAVLRGIRAAYQSFMETVGRVDDLAKSARALNMTAAELAAFRYAGKLAGVSAKQLQVGLKMMTKNVGDAALGFGEARLALRELRMDANMLAAQKPEEQFALIAEELSKVGSTTKQTSLVMKLFGEQGIILLNVLRQGRRALDEARAATRKYGTAMTEDQVKKIEDVRDATTRLTEAWSGFKDQLVTAIGPAIVGVLDTIADSMSDVEKRSPRGRGGGVSGGWLFGTDPAVQRQLTEGITPLMPEEFARATSPSPFQAGVGGITSGLDVVAKTLQVIREQMHAVQTEVEQEAQLAAQLTAEVLANQERDRLAMTGEERAIWDSYQARLDMLNEFYEQHDELGNEWRERMLAAETEYNRNVEQISRRSAQARAQHMIDLGNTTIGMFSAIVEASGASARDQFEWTKALDIAQTVMNTATAIMKVYADMGPFATVQAAMIAATGAAQIAAIAGTTFEGGGGVGGGASAAATTAAAPAAQLTRNVNVTLVGDTANMDSVRDLIHRIQEENEDGAVLNLRTY